MARRQANPPSAITPGSANPSQSTTGGTGTQDVPTLSSLSQDVFTGDGSTVAFTLSTAPSGGLAMVFWNAGGGIMLPSDYSISGTTLTTSFKDAGGNAIAAQSGDKIYVVYFT
jgi:hypothetical protein